MSPAGSGRAQFRGGPGATVDGADLQVRDQDPPKPRAQSVTIENVKSLLDGAQRLVDSRPSSGYPVDWCVEAAYIGDLGAIAAAAVIAARSASPAH